METQCSTAVQQPFLDIAIIALTHFSGNLQLGKDFPKKRITFCVFATNQREEIRKKSQETIAQRIKVVMLNLY
jgi:hypothetical protein